MTTENETSSKNLIEGNYYDKYNSKNPLVRFVMKIFNGVLLKFIAQANPKTVLDVGCGEGYTTALIKEEFPGIEISGIELGEKTLKKAQTIHNRINFEHGSIYDIEKNNESYDLALSSEVLEHLDDPLKGLIELKRVSRRFVIVSVPNEPWWRIVNMLRFYYLKDLGNTPGHVNHWSKKSFELFLMPHFSKVQIKNALIWNIALCEK